MPTSPSTRCPGKIFQGQGDGNRLASGAAQFGAGDHANHHQHSGSQRFQSGGDPRRVHRKICGPGLSTTAKIKTAEKKNVIAIPIQALAVRTRKDLEEAAKNAKKGSSSSVALAAPPPARRRQRS